MLITSVHTDPKNTLHRRWLIAAYIVVIVAMDASLLLTTVCGWGWLAAAAIAGTVLITAGVLFTALEMLTIGVRNRNGAAHE